MSIRFGYLSIFLAVPTLCSSYPDLVLNSVMKVPVDEIVLSTTHVRTDDTDLAPAGYASLASII